MSTTVEVLLSKQYENNPNQTVAYLHLFCVLKTRRI